LQLGETTLVVARQVPVSFENFGLVLEPVTLADDGGADLEGCAVEGSGRRDDGNPVAGAKRARLMKNSVRQRVRT
jgi:hypothetical protein